MWHRAVLACAAAAFLAAAAPARAQSSRVQFGPRFSVSDDADLGVGADVRWPFLRSDRRLALSLSFDWFFPEEESADFSELQDLLALFGGGRDLPPLPVFELETDLTYWEANLNLTYDFGTTGAVTPYAGVGVNFAHSEVTAFGVLDLDFLNEGDDEVGANVLAGVRFARRFYVEAKREAGGGELFMVTAGVRF
jgi:hypothetical protein